MKRDGGDDEGNSPKRGRFHADEKKSENSGEDENSSDNEDSGEGRNEDSEDPMYEITEFLKKHADLTSEQLEEVQKKLEHHGINNFELIRTYEQDDLIKNFKLTEETAKKIQLAIMKKTCILFAEWAENGGIPSPKSGSAGPSESGTVREKEESEEHGKQQQPGCRVS
jgi:hypothetical protein